MKRCNRPSSIALLFAGLCAVPLLADAAAAQGLQGREYYDWIFQNEPEWAEYRD